MTVASGPLDWIPPHGTADVLRRVIRRPTATKDLIRDLGLHPTSAARATSWLRDRGLITEGQGTSTSLGGRPTVPYKPSNALLLIGIEIVDHGGYPAQLVPVVTDVGGKPFTDFPVERVLLGPDDRNDAGPLISRISDLIAEMKKSLESEYEAVVLGAGVAVGGHVKDGVVMLTPGVGWAQQQAWSRLGSQICLEERLSAELDLPVCVANDVTALTAKILMLDAEVDDFAVLCLFGDGIGGGLALDGRLWRGKHSLASEPGHIVVDYRADAPLCRCGNRGCLEAFTAPARLLKRLARDVAIEETDTYGVMSMRSAGLRPEEDEDIARVFADAGGALGRGLANIVNTVDPGTIYVFAPPELLEPAKRSAAGLWKRSVKSEFYCHAFSTGADTDIRFIAMPLIQLETLAAVGAACLVSERLLSELEDLASSDEGSSALRRRVADRLPRPRRAEKATPRAG